MIIDGTGPLGHSLFLYEGWRWELRKVRMVAPLLSWRERECLTWREGAKVYRHYKQSKYGKGHHLNSSQ